MEIRKIGSGNIIHTTIWEERPRVFVLTNISNEPKDEESLMRLLVYANESSGRMRRPGMRRRGSRSFPGRPGHHRQNPLVSQPAAREETDDAVTAHHGPFSCLPRNPPRWPG